MWHRSFGWLVKRGATGSLASWLSDCVGRMKSCEEVRTGCVIKVPLGERWDWYRLGFAASVPERACFPSLV